jgi:O-antigen ligase
MSAVELIILIASCVSIAGVAYASFIRAPYALPLLVALLPVLNLARKAFPETAPPFPSLETVAVGMLWFGLTLRLMLESRKRVGPVSGLGHFGLLFLGIFLFFALLSTMASEDRGRSIRILLAGGIGPYACYYLTLRYMRTREDIHRVVFGVIAMGIVAGIYTLMNLQNRLGQAGGVLGSVAASWLYNEAPIVNVFFVPSEAVAATIPVLPLSLWYARYGQRYRLPVLAVALSAFGLISIFSFSRGSWLATLAAILGSLLVLHRGRRLRIAAAVTVGLALVIVILGQYLMPVLEARLQSGMSGSGGNSDTRIANYALAIRSGLRYPFIGVGLGSYPAIYVDFPQADAPFLSFAHSLMLTLIPEVGAVGAAAFVLCFAAHIAMAFKRRSVPQADAELHRAIGVGILALILVASTSGCHLVSYLLTETEWTYFTAPAMIVAFTLMGLVASKPKASLPPTDVNPGRTVSHQ